MHAPSRQLHPAEQSQSGRQVIEYSYSQADFRKLATKQSPMHDHLWPAITDRRVSVKIPCLILYRQPFVCIAALLTSLSYTSIAYAQEPYDCIKNESQLVGKYTLTITASQADSSTKVGAIATTFISTFILQKDGKIISTLPNSPKFTWDIDKANSILSIKNGLGTTEVSFNTFACSFKNAPLPPVTSMTGSGEGMDEPGLFQQFVATRINFK
jgi:hypothetical protein